ncbi:MAG TPA: MaoC family dehydratase, partial [Dehalococcoidia bacterium]|nr:MaoC family dehydratase [Dehalococcoidia bacterium]
MNAPEVAPLSRTVTREAIAAYADAVGDHNPIHVDEAFARTTPFGGVIAHGMLALAYVSETMERAFGERWARSGRLKVRFKLPARPG